MKILFFLKPKKDLAYLDDSFTLRNAMEKIEHYRFSELPLVKKSTGEFIKSVSEGDILWYIKKANAFLDVNFLNKINILDVPNYHHYKAISIDADIEDLIPLAKSQNYIPVVDDRKVFIGIITRQDVIDYIYNNSNLVNKKEQ